VSNAVLPKISHYIGVMGTWTLFDFGKREHGVKEASAQAEAADLAVQLTRQVAQGVKRAISNWKLAQNSVNWRAGWCPRLK